MLRKILTTQPKGPYIIGGACIGSVLAYEVASQLRAAGEEVSLLLMIDAPTPTLLEVIQGFDYQAEASTLLSVQSGTGGWLAQESGESFETCDPILPPFYPVKVSRNRK